MNARRRRTDDTGRAFHVVARMLVVLALLTAATACTGDGDPQVSPSPTPSPTPRTEGFDPVEGDVEVETMSVHAGEPVFTAGDPNAQEPPTNEAAVAAFVDEITAWLNGHLDALQEGGSGRLEEVAGPGLLQSGGPQATVDVTTRLASPERLVRRASYEITVAVDGDPQWAVIVVTVTPRNGDPAAAALTFVPGDEGLVLEAAGSYGVQAGQGEGT